MVKHKVYCCLPKLFLCFCVSLLFIGCKSNIEPNTIIPFPQSVSYTGKTFETKVGSQFYTNLSGKEKDDLSEYLKASPLALQSTDAASSARISFDIVSTIGDTLTVDGGYSMSISNKNIKVEATSSAGIFYAVQSLLQLANIQDNGLVTFPTVDVVDYPRFEYRGMHLDVSRHFYSKEFIKKQLDAMARYKLNYFHWHLTDGAGWRLQIDRYPELTQKGAFRPYKTWKEWWKADRHYCDENDENAEGGYYTKDDVKEIVEYARQRHITVIPEIEMPAHSEEVTAIYPELSCTGIPYTTAEFCIGKEATFEFLQNVLLETIDMFPTEYIHIGGDEANKNTWKACKACQKRMKDEGLKDVDELQSYLIHRMQEFLQSQNKKMIGWDEILEGGLAPNSIVMSWRGEEGGIKAVQQGHEVIMTPGGYCYFDSYQDAPINEPEAIGGYTTLAKVYSYNPVPEEVKDKAHLIKGVQANLWTEYIPTPEHAEYMLYPRILALSEIAWTNPSNKSWDRFHEKALKEVDWLQANGYNTFDLKNEVGAREGSETPIDHLARGKKVIYNSAYSSQYPAGGDSALVDGYCGDWMYNDNRWQGFVKKYVDVVIDLGEVTPIKSIKTEFMQLAGPWLWMPTEVVYSVSMDGENFTELTKIETQTSPEYELLAFETYQWEGESEARYISVYAKRNEEKTGWLFLDEIIVR